MHEIVNFWMNMLTIDETTYIFSLLRPPSTLSLRRCNPLLNWFTYTLFLLHYTALTMSFYEGGHMPINLCTQYDVFLR